MGSGSRIKQYKRRFFEGEQTREEREEETFYVLGAFGEYEVHGAEGGGYELLKGSKVVGIFSEARVEENRVVFELSHGMNLEVSEKGIRKILTPEKAELCGLIASDGTICKYRGKEESEGYEVSLTTTDYELVQVFEELCRKVYDVTPYRHLKHHKTSKGEREHYYVAMHRREIAYDLWDLNIKGKPYEFHPPLEHLDEEGKRAYLRGFFSGDGNVSLSRDGSHAIRIYSKCEDGLRELRKALIDLGFHPSEIHIRSREASGRHSGPEYSFSIPEEDHIKFIDEIGSEKEKHISRFQLIESINGKKRRGNDDESRHNLGMGGKVRRR